MNRCDDYEFMGLWEKLCAAVTGLVPEECCRMVHDAIRQYRSIYMVLNI